MSGETALRREVTVMLPNGLHLRPISLIARTATTFDCEITILKDGRTANARNPLDLMSLNSRQGDRLIVEVRGDGAAEALQAILPLFEMLDEDEPDVA